MIVHRVLLCALFLLESAVSSALTIPSLSILKAHRVRLFNQEEKSDKDDSKTTVKDSKAATKDTKHQPQNKPVKFLVSPIWARILYSLTAINPALAVIFNDYARMIEPVKQIQTHNRLAAAYETIFFFARLKPRVSFAIGAILRALQLTTAFQYVFDPLAGVGFGLNGMCLFAKSRWPATIVLGWSVTKPMWKVLGACPPSGLPVPITVSFRKVESVPDLSRAGYSLGIRS